MKRTKILAILVVGVMSVSLLATVEKPDDVPKGKGWDQVWDALVDLQGQIVQEIADRIAGDDEEEAARIAADADLQAALNQEISDRIAGDDEEEAARIAADGGLQAQIDAIELVPSGVIVMWSGSIGDIPDGWALCDGSDGTPDLRDKFICGVSEGEEPGAEGGSAEHTHTVDGHTHSVDPPFTKTGTPDRSNSSNYGGGGSSYWHWTGPKHRHGVDVSEFSSGAASPNTSAESHLPPYYKLAFIMKL